jgi:phosphonate transport system substrate-binding protein
MEQRWRPFLADMQSQTGLKVEPYFAPTYDALVEAMRFGRTQAGWYSNYPGLEAVRRADGEVFAAATAPEGSPPYVSLLLVKASSPITLDQALKCGRHFSLGLGDPHSTSGTLAPMTYLFAPRGVDPQACFKAVRRANHEVNLESVAGGALDMATGNSINLQIMQRMHPGLVRGVKTIWASPPLPDDPFIWRKDLDPAVKEKLRAFLLGYGKAPGAEGDRQRKILNTLGFGPFKPADDSHLLPTREMEATEQLMEAKTRRDQSAQRRAEAELAKIKREEEKVAKSGG